MYRLMLSFFLAAFFLIFSGSALAADVDIGQHMSSILSVLGFLFFLLSLLMFLNGNTVTALMSLVFATVMFNITDIVKALFGPLDKMPPNAGIENTKDALTTEVVGLEGANEPSLAGALLLSVGVGIGILVGIWAYNYFYRRDLDRESMVLFERIREENNSAAAHVAADDVPLDSDVADLPDAVDPGASGQKPLPGKRRVNLD